MHVFHTSAPRISVRFGHLVFSLLLSLLPAEAKAAAAQTVTAGPEVKILDNAQWTKARLPVWPDGTFGILKSGSTYSFFAAHGSATPDGTPTRGLGTLDNPIAYGTTMGIAIQNMKNNYGYVGGGPIYRNGSLLLMFYHAETPHGDGNFSTTLGMAKSTNAGDSWTDLGPIITANYPLIVTPGRCTTDLGGGTFLINGGYFIVSFRDRLTDCSEIYVAAARAKVLDVVSAAENQNDVVPWTKYFNGSWSEPGLGGRSTELADGKHVSWRSISYNSYLRKWIMVAQARPDPSIRQVKLTLFQSSDGLFWTNRMQLESDPGNSGYPTIVGLGNDPGVSDAEFYVYYLSFTSFLEDGGISRRTIRLRRSQ